MRDTGLGEVVKVMTDDLFRRAQKIWRRWIARDRAHSMFLIVLIVMGLSIVVVEDVGSDIVLGVQRSSHTEEVASTKSRRHSASVCRQLFPLWSILALPSSSPRVTLLTIAFRAIYINLLSMQITTS